MTQLVSKYSIGEKVWIASTTRKSFRHDCPDCLGSKKWKSVSPAGSEYSFACPRCSARYTSNNNISLDYYKAFPEAQLLTIGSIRIDTHDKEPVWYMCVETGVGGGSLYKESTVFATKEEAISFAQIEADNFNKTDERTIAQYNASLQISDYELGEARDITEKAALEEKLRKAKYIIDDIEDAIDFDEVKEIVNNYREAA